MLSHDELEALRSLDTCTVSNVIESFDLRLRNEGFAVGSIRCLFPNLAPMLGYAVTVRIRTSSAPMAGRWYYDRMDFWAHVATVPAPRVIVAQDVDRIPGCGALFGELHASIARALGCVGYVTNGAVRDLAAVEAAGFHLFAGSVAVSHSYAHLVEFGDAVEIGGLRVQPGDLLHGDRHGVHSIPESIAPEIPRAASELLQKERGLVDFCRSPHFSLEGLAEKLREMSG